MKFSLLATAIALIGLGWLVIGITRWYFIYQDYSEIIRTLFEGGGTIAFAYIYQKFRWNDERFEDETKRTDLLTDELFKVKPKDKLPPNYIQETKKERGSTNT